MAFVPHPDITEGQDKLSDPEMMRSPPPPLPARIGPVEFAEFGRMVAVRCPRELAHVMQRAGGVWEPGSRRWLIDRRRVGPVIRALERETDPLFRQAGMSLD